MTQFAKVTALVAAAPLLSGLVGLWNLLAALIVLIVGFVAFIWIGTKIMKDVEYNRYAEILKSPISRGE